MNVIGLVSEASIIYTSGQDMELVANQYVASNVVTPAAGIVTLQILVRLATTAIMYLRSNGANGACLNSLSIPADTWFAFETPWSSETSFSVRFSASITVRDLVINGEA